MKRCWTIALAAVLWSTPSLIAADEAAEPLRHYLATFRLGPAYQPGVPIPRQPAFPAHAAYMDQLDEQGVVLVGGPILESFESMTPVAAVLLLTAASLDEARELAALDESGLLKLESVRPMLLAIGTASGAGSGPR